MGRNKRNFLERRKPFREPRKLFLLVCGGLRTEPSYFEGLREKYRDRLIRLDIIPGTRAPLDIVKKATTLRAKNEEDAVDDFDRIDYVWCIFDTDEFDLVQAINLADKNGISTAVSNPCFELWLVLHFQNQSAHISTRDVRNLCKRLIPGYEKNVDISKIWNGHEQAIRRAKKLAEGHIKQGNPRANPSTEIHRIIAQIEQSRARSGFAKR